MGMIPTLIIVDAFCEEVKKNMIRGPGCSAISIAMTAAATTTGVSWTARNVRSRSLPVLEVHVYPTIARPVMAHASARASRASP